MKSPRFSVREPKLKKIFTTSSLKAAWKEKIRPSLRNRYILDPIEHLDFHVNVTAECLKIERLICEGSYQPASAIRILLEKSKGLCRQIVMPTLQDSIVLQRLSDALYADIKGKAPSRRSYFEPEDQAFSKQQKNDKGAPSYGSLKAWLDFQKNLLKFSKVRKYVVVTDVANYYDFISYSQLRNILSGTIDVDEVVLDTLIFLLSGLLWQPDYMPRAEIGLPQIDIDASRILAHCFLYELDEFLEKQKHIDFARYMDDIDVGVDKMIDARRILRDIDLILQTRQIRLNSGKTKILTSEEAQLHFCVKQNNFLDMLGRRIDKKQEKGLSIEYERKMCEDTAKKLYKSGVFDRGNGDKILKRSLTISRKVGAEIDHSLIKDILINRPSSREHTFYYLSAQKLNSKRFLFIMNFIFDGQIVDEVSLISATECLVDSMAIKTLDVRNYLNIFNNRLKNSKSVVEIHILLWLNSKYSKPETLILLIRETFDSWRADAVLGRLVGGLRPIFITQKQKSDYCKLLNNAKNSDANVVAEFHDKIVNDRKAAGAIQSIIQATNPSKPLGITHPKLLLGLSYLSSRVVSDAMKIKFINSHSKAITDPFYRKRLRNSLPKKLRHHIK